MSDALTKWTEGLVEAVLEYATERGENMLRNDVAVAIRTYLASHPPPPAGEARARYLLEQWDSARPLNVEMWAGAAQRYLRQHAGESAPEPQPSRPTDSERLDAMLRHGWEIGRDESAEVEFFARLGSVLVRAPTIGEVISQVCASVRFGDEPSIDSALLAAEQAGKEGSDAE